MWARALLSLLSTHVLCCLVIAGCGGTASSSDTGAPTTGAPTTGAGTVTVGHYVIAAATARHSATEYAAFAETGRRLPCGSRCPRWRS